jgi:F-type H+-transporting ATPase subunit b
LININWTILWEVINFLVLMWLLKYYLYGPVTEILNQRSNLIRNEIKEAEEKNIEAGRLREQYRKELKEIKIKARSILEEAEIKAGNRSREIIREARRETEIIKQKERQELEKAKKEALMNLKNEVVAISLLIAGKIIQENIDQKRHEELIKQYIEKLGQERIGEF